MKVNYNVEVDSNIAVINSKYASLMYDFLKSENKNMVIEFDNRYESDRAYNSIYQTFIKRKGINSFKMHRKKSKLYIIKK